MTPALLTSILLLFLLITQNAVFGQEVDRSRLRELRVKSRNGQLTPAEQAELVQGMESLRVGRPATPSATAVSSKVESGKQPLPDAASPEDRKAMAAERRAQYEERQTLSLERMRQIQKEALTAAAARPVPGGPAHEYFVNNETGDDTATGLAPMKSADSGPVRTLAKGVSLLKPGDTLHLAVTRLPYRETLTLNDGCGGVPGKPIVIDGHGATITGCDPLRLEGWVDAGSPGLYKSSKLLSELQEFGEAAKIMRVFFVFDGVMQHMGRSSKGKKPALESPASLQPGEWTYVQEDKTFIHVRPCPGDGTAQRHHHREGRNAAGEHLEFPRHPPVDG